MQRKVPSAITNITLNRATFTDVPIDGLTFVNFFYGNNGAGKSSIAHAIAEGDEGVVWADGKTADDYDVLVYNQDFINDNFMSYGDLKGVFIFGEEDIEAKKKIAELTEQKKQKSDARLAALEEHKKKTAAKESALVQFQETCFTKTAEIRRRFDKCMDGKKQKKNFSEAVLAEKKPADHDLAELERLYDVAFDDTARTFPEFKKAAATTYGSLPGKDLLDRVIVSSSDTPFAKFMKALGDTASDWVRDGHTHYAGAAGGKCPYCQQKLPANFESDIAATFDAQYQQDVRDLGQFQATYARETAEIVRVLRANLDDVMTSIDLHVYQEKLALLESNFEINRQRIAEKVKEPSKTISLEDTDTLLLDIGALIDDINKRIKANNDVVTAKRTSKAKCKTEIMQYLAFMLAADVKSYLDEDAQLDKGIAEITERGKKLKKEIGELTTEISALNKHNANTEAAIDSINKILRDSGFQGFSIRAKADVENVYEVIREDGSVAENLSEGERNFIAFLYFYHQVRGSMNSEELKEKIVVIDDPVSSMDSTALFLVSAIVREMVNVCRNNTEYLNPKVPGDYIKQLFVLTHNVYFHREVTYQQVGYYNCTSFYMIRKNDNISTIKLCKRQSKDVPTEEENYNPVQNSYAALWDELRDIKSTIPALNVMRRILEYYFLQLCGYEGSDLREIVLDEHRNEFIKQVEGEKPDMTDYQLASSLLAYINNPNGISDGLNYVEDCEDVDAYKRVFRMIFEALGQSQHYKMMTGKYVISKSDAKKTYGFAKYLRDSFPNATYVGFTGTPVDATLRVFGEVVVQYTMKQSLDDGSTVGIARLPGPREVQLDEKMAQACDEYYRLQAEAGANEYQIEKSKKDMTNLKIILGNSDRLDIVVRHFIWHYEKRCEEHATVNGKAMFVCYDREIAWTVYNKIKALRPEWFVKRKCAPEYEGTAIDRDSIEIEKVMLVCTNGKNDPAEMTAVIGDSKTRKAYARAFKDNKSNLKIAIVVDMWITGFDVPSMDTMYLDKPVETHNLIQTISRVNRVFKGKKEGLIVDYIGLEGAILTAMKLYNGDITPINGVDTSLVVFKDFLDRIIELMHGYDYSAFFTEAISPLERLTIIQKGVEYVLAEKARKDNFMGFTLRCKKAFDVCIGHDAITAHEVEQLHYFLCVRSVIFKMTSGDTSDATLMNQHVAELVDRAISSTYSGKSFNFDEQPTDDIQMLFSDEFIEKLKRIPYPNTKYQALVKLLKRAIKEFGKTNRLKAIEFSKKLKNVIDRYNSRNTISDVEDIIEDVVDNLSEELEKIFSNPKKEKQSFEAMDITYEEKAFYDILIAVAEKYGFKDQLAEDTYIFLAKEIQKLVGNKSKYTDWTNRQDVKDELYADVAKLLKKHGYPPRTIDDAYDEIMKQVDNYKQYAD